MHQNERGGRVITMSKKQKAFELFSQGKRPSDPEVKSLGLKSKSLYNYYQEWKKSSGAGQLTGTMKGKSLVVPLGKETEEVTETAVLKLVPQVQTLPLTPDIFVSYMCAVKNGYEGTLSDWLSLVSRDFWFGRGRNFYEEVSGISSSRG